MDLSTVFIILCTIVITTTAAPIAEEDVVVVDDENNGHYEDIVEGDMLLTKDQQDTLYGTAVNTRNGLVDPARRWPNNTVVYYFAENVFDTEQIKIIENAMAGIANKSCLKFRPRENDEEHAVVIQNYRSYGCASGVGFVAKGQVLNLANGCVTHATASHQLLHTLGFHHMQSTYNRDDYVTIQWKNIIPRQMKNFVKYDSDVVTDFNVTYDYHSLMHYPKDAFSKNRKDTITPNEKGVTIGPGNDLTERDILKLNRMYNC